MSMARERKSIGVIGGGSAKPRMDRKRALSAHQTPQHKGSTSCLDCGTSEPLKQISTTATPAAVPPSRKAAIILTSLAKPGRSIGTISGEKSKSRMDRKRGGKAPKLAKGGDAALHPAHAIIHTVVGHVLGGAPAGVLDAVHDAVLHHAMGAAGAMGGGDDDYRQGYLDGRQDAEAEAKGPARGRGTRPMMAEGYDMPPMPSRGRS